MLGDSEAAVLGREAGSDMSGAEAACGTPPRLALLLSRLQYCPLPCPLLSRGGLERRSRLGGPSRPLPSLPLPPVALRCCRRDSMSEADCITREESPAELELLRRPWPSGEPPPPVAAGEGTGGAHCVTLLMWSM